MLAPVNIATERFAAKPFRYRSLSMVHLLNIVGLCFTESRIPWYLNAFLELAPRRQGSETDIYIEKGPT